MQLVSSMLVLELLQSADRRLRICWNCRPVTGSWVQVGLVVASPLRRALETARPVAELQALAGNTRPDIETCDLLVDRDWGTFEGRLVQEVS